MENESYRSFGRYADYVTFTCAAFHVFGVFRYLDNVAVVLDDLWPRLVQLK